MSQPFLGEVRPWACTFAPKQWAFCRGQLLPIPQNTALYSLLGTIYGGNGTTNFALPDLQGRVPMAYGTAPSGGSYGPGQKAGTEQITLLSSNMPVHTHTFTGTSAKGNKSAPANGDALAQDSKGDAFYATVTATTHLNPGTISRYPGNSLPHENRQPYLAINWCIALAGIFPSRN